MIPLDNISAEEVSYGQWGRCVKLSNGNIELLATLDFGPRIIRFGFVGGSNEFFEDASNDVSQGGKKFEVYGDRGAWHIYGGHRLWTSPEDLPRSYYPDNEPVLYEKTEGGICLIPPPQTWTNIEEQTTVVMSGSTDEVTVTHRVKNIGAWMVELAPWAITCMAPGGLEIVPQPKKDTGLLGNRLVGLWPYSDMADARVHWGTDYITLEHDAGAVTNFKFGINSEAGFAAYFNHGNMFVKYFYPVPDGKYPDGGLSFETYTNKSMVEIESIGHLTPLESGQSVTHVERWKLVRGVNAPAGRGFTDDTQIAGIVDKYIL